MGNLRDRIKAKAQHKTTYKMVIVDDATADAAEAAYTGSQTALRRAVAAKDAKAQKTAQAAVDLARAGLAACVDVLVFEALESHVFEALIVLHEPTEAQQAEGKQWNAETFSPALIAACSVEQGMTEAEWAEELATKRWSLADRNDIFTKALSANVTARSVTVPKG